MWTPTELRANFQWGSGTLWRAVENQFKASTRRITDTLDEQSRLEELVEGNKPPVPESARGLDYLLMTPFRYRPPHPRGSRFRRPHAPWGLFYAAEARRTALAELSYHRYQFFLASEGTELPATESLLTLFSVSYAVKHQIDLSRPPLDRDKAKWTDPNDYSGTQALAEAAREAGAQSIRNESVRDPEPGKNVALLDPAGFRTQAPSKKETWKLHLGDIEAAAIPAIEGEVEPIRFKRADWDLPEPPE